jgi:hypothetical protein
MPAARLASSPSPAAKDARKRGIEDVAGADRVDDRARAAQRRGKRCSSCDPRRWHRSGPHFTTTIASLRHALPQERAPPPSGSADTSKVGRLHLVEQRDPAARQPAHSPPALFRLGPAVQRPAGIERDGDVMAIGPVEEAVVVLHQPLRQERAAEERDAALEPRVRRAPQRTSSRLNSGRCPRVVKKVRSPSGWVMPTESVVLSPCTGQVLARDRRNHSPASVPNWSAPMLAAISKGVPSAIQASAALPAEPPTRSSSWSTMVSVPGCGQGAAGPMIRSTLTFPMTASGSHSFTPGNLGRAHRRSGIFTRARRRRRSSAAARSAAWRRRRRGRSSGGKAIVAAPAAGGRPDASNMHEPCAPASTTEVAIAVTRSAVASSPRKRTTPTSGESISIGPCRSWPPSSEKQGTTREFREAERDGLGEPLQAADPTSRRSAHRQSMASACID